MLIGIRICLFKIPDQQDCIFPISGLDTKFLNPPFAGFSQAFPALETPLLYIQNTAQCTPYISIVITPFSYKGVSSGKDTKDVEMKVKTTLLLLKEISGWIMLNGTPLVYIFSGRTLSHEKYPCHSSEILTNTHAVPPTSGVGGGGGGLWGWHPPLAKICHWCIHVDSDTIFDKISCISKIAFSLP